MRQIQKIACLLLLIFAVTGEASAARSPVNTQAARKQQVPAWLRREHHYEEMCWNASILQNFGAEDEDFEVKEPDPQDLEYLAIVIFCEAGADAQCDETRYMVGDIVLNRVADSRYPDTIEEVLLEERQFGRFYWTGIIWPERASYARNAHAVDRAREIAYNLLTDTRHSDLYGKGYIYQDNRVQGKDNVWSDGICFGR